MNEARRLTLRGIFSALLTFALVLQLMHTAPAADLTGSYSWKPVKIGAGGWMQGMAVHPLNANVRYARGDVDNIYRWDSTNSVWVPMEVSSALPANVTVDPSDAFPGAIAVDPANTNVVLCAYTFIRSSDTAPSHADVPLNVYRSTNGGVTFTAGNLSVGGETSQEHRGERLAVDPNNSSVVYFGSPQNGLWRSMDGGVTWSNVTANGAPASTANAVLPRFDKGGGTVSFLGKTVSKRLYITLDYGSILQSDDGGNSWTIISTGSEINGYPGFATVDQNGRLLVCNMSNGNLDIRTRAGAWSQVGPPNGVWGVTVDPNNANRIFGTKQGGSCVRSLNGGTSWTDLGGSLNFSSSQTIQWIIPSSIRPNGHSVSNGGIYMDAAGKLWIPSGNDGILSTTPNDATDTLSNPPAWVSVSQGIEEMVANHLTIPPGGSPVCMVADEAFFTISNPDTFTAKHTPLNLWSGGSGHALGMDVNYCPNQPHYMVETAESDPNYGSTRRYSGYSTDGGTTWSKFPSIVNGTHPCPLYNGLIAVAPRAAGHQNDGPGGDNIVWCPVPVTITGAQLNPNRQCPAPFYSTDGGATWTQTHSFDTVAGATTNQNQCQTTARYTYLPAWWGAWSVWVHQHQLEADPLIRGTFYWVTTNGGIWKTTDGGANWTKQTGSGLPSSTHHGQLCANPTVSGDLWFCDGFEGATAHGLYHTTNGGASFTQISAFSNAWELALGKSSVTGGYPTIFVYGKLASDPAWGVFRSTDQGVTWDRIAYNPTGLLDLPASSAASWDTFGQYYIGFGGNSFVYGTPSGPPPVPSAPTGLTASAGNTQVTLNWFSSPNATSYNVHRGTTPGGESATAIATGITGLTFTNTGLTNGTTYYYKVTATNASGTSGYSSEASAVPAPQPPPAPAGLLAISGDTQVGLSWSAASGATSYNVYRSTTAGAEVLVASGIAATSYVNTGLTNGTTYYYKVAGVNTTGTGALSAEASAKPMAANAQIPFTATAPTIDGAVDSAWSAATSYPMPNVTGTIPAGATNSGTWRALWDATNLYVLVDITDSTVVANNDGVEVYIDGINAKSLGYTGTTWQWVFINGGAVQEYQSGNGGSNITGIVKADGALAGGWRMECKIPWTTIGVAALASDNIGLDVAYNNYNVAGTRANKLFWFSTADNDWTNPSLFGTAKLMPVSGVPPVPTGLTATAGNTQVALSWSASAGATSYNVKRSTVSGSGYATVSSPATTSYTNTGLTNGTTYYYVVSAVNASGESANSSQVTAAPSPTPPIPAGVAAYPGIGQALISWTASTGATSYNVKRSTVSGSGYATVGSPTAVSYMNTGLTNGTTYYYVVTAVSASGESANSSQVSASPSATVPQAQVPNTSTAPTIDGAVDAAWSSATSYLLSKATGTVSSAADCSATWKAMWDATNLYILVDVNDDVKTNDSTNPWDDDSAEVYLDADHNGGTAYDANDRQIDFGWGDASPVEGAGRSITGVSFAKADPTSSSYRIEIKIPWSVEAYTPAGNAIVGIDVHVNDDDDGAARDGKQIWNDGTDGAWGNPSLFGTAKLLAAAGSPPPTPTGLTATAGNTQVSLSWNASSGATAYDLKRSTVSGSGYATITSPTGTSYTNTGLTNGTTYYYVVAAKNASGSSANSSQVSATPAAGNTHAGTWACKAVVTGTPSFKNLDQTVNTPSNTAYVANFWLKGSGKVTLRVFMGSGTEITRSTFTATSTWTQCSVSFNTGASTSTKFNITDDGAVAGTCYIDDCFMGVSGGTNVLSNVGFESGNTVWIVDNPPFSIVQNP